MENQEKTVMLYDFLSKQTFKVFGRVTELESGLGVGGLSVKAVDKDLVFDDLLGSASTDKNGNFDINYRGEDFEELFDRQPDIFVQVKSLELKRILYTSENTVRWNAGKKEYFNIQIPRAVLGELSPTMEENQMKREIGKITLEINPEQLERIAGSGRMEEFIAKATTLFNRDLKAELVKGSASSVSTALAYMENDDFGTGPRPPFWHNIAQIDELKARINTLEKVISLNFENMEQFENPAIQTKTSSY